MSEDIVIVGMARTPMGGLMGELSGITATRLGSIAVRAAMTEAGLDGADQIIMGNVLSAGLGQAPARQAAIGAGLDKSTEAVTLNKMCGSGLQAVAMARQALLADEANVAVAGQIDADTIAEVRADPGVAAAYAYSAQQISYEGEPVVVGGGDFASWVDRGRLLFKSPSNGRQQMHDAIGRR